LIGLGVLGGCGGGYVLTAPDAVAPAGGEAPTVVRLQRKELPLVAPPAQAAPLRFRVAEGPTRAARTDKKGYASAAVPVPQTVGVFPMTVALQDVEGRETAWELRTFVWAPDRPIVAVDLEALPHGGRGVEQAKTALENLALHANVLYLSDHSVAKFPKLRKALAAAGLPDGPILSWRAKGWWTQQVVSPLAGLRKVFPKLRGGIAGSRLAVRAFESAGMKCLVVGGKAIAQGRAVQCMSWAELVEKAEQVDMGVGEEGP
jgi:hypothetical protein